MSIEKKVGKRLPPEAKRFRWGDVELNVGLDKGRVTDVNCLVRLKRGPGKCDVVLHKDEAMVIRGDDLRFYKFKGGKISRMERLFAGIPKEIDKELENFDRSMIESARHLFEEASEHIEEFEAEEFVAKSHSED